MLTPGILTLDSISHLLAGRGPSGVTMSTFFSVLSSGLSSGLSSHFLMQTIGISTAEMTCWRTHENSSQMAKFYFKQRGLSKCWVEEMLGECPKRHLPGREEGRAGTSWSDSLLSLCSAWRPSSCGGTTSRHSSSSLWSGRLLGVEYWVWGTVRLCARVSTQYTQLCIMRKQANSLRCWTKLMEKYREHPPSVSRTMTSPPDRD